MGSPPWTTGTLVASCPSVNSFLVIGLSRSHPLNSLIGSWTQVGQDIGTVVH